MHCAVKKEGSIRYGGACPTLDQERGGACLTLMKETAVAQIGIGMIGTGGIALANHLPGFSYCPDTKVVALCDANPQALEKARQQTGITAAFTDYHQLLARPDVHAVVIATPNNVHAPITLAAAAAGKHILCEKPIAMDYAQSLKMLA